MEGIGPFIRRRRDELDLSLRELAKRLDCSPAFISDIELGRRHPSDKVLVEIARILKVKVEELREMDVRAPIDEIKRITQDDPTFALAFRTVIDKNISADELLEFVKKKEDAEERQGQEMKPFRSGPSSKQPYFTPTQIDQICCDELRKRRPFPERRRKPSASTASSKSAFAYLRNTKTSCRGAGFHQVRQERCKGRRHFRRSRRRGRESR